jgi:bifunctional DNase/RNase
VEEPLEDGAMVEVSLRRIVVREGADRQYIYLADRSGKRGFPIVIGNNEAGEIHRVVHGYGTERPLTHQLAHDTIRALGAAIKNVDIVDLRQNTFYAQLVLQNDAGDVIAVVDARPSDAIALALRAGCPIRVAEEVMQKAAVEVEEEEEED